MARKSLAAKTETVQCIQNIAFSAQKRMTYGNVNLTQSSAAHQKLWVLHRQINISNKKTTINAYLFPATRFWLKLPTVHTAAHVVAATYGSDAASVWDKDTGLCDIYSYYTNLWKHTKSTTFQARHMTDDQTNTIRLHTVHTVIIVCSCINLWHDLKILMNYKHYIDLACDRIKMFITHYVKSYLNNEKSILHINTT